MHFEAQYALYMYGKNVLSVFFFFFFKKKKKNIKDESILFNVIQIRLCS